MSNFSHYSFQQAVYQLLSSDSTLLALVDAVYDRPPQGSPFPYITLGDMAISDWSTKTSTGTEILLTIYIWSRSGGRKETADISDRVYRLLHQASVSVSGQALVQIRYLSSDIQLDDDGITYQGMMRFRSLLEATA
jgi:hypothetical protein